MDPALLELLAEGAPDDEVAVVLRLADGLPPPTGARIVVRFGAIATCRLQRGAIPQVRSEVGVLSMKAPHAYRAEPDQEADSVDDDAAEDEDLALRDSDQRRPDHLQETGRGVLLAHIDWGADVKAASFRHADGRTRFAALWDQGAPYDPMHPNRYGYGRIHTAADIDRALQTDDAYVTLGYHPARGKPAGGSHGTHTLGISAGNGRSGGPLGLAPEAMLAFVDLSTQRQPAGSGLGDSAALLEGLDFIAELAESLGTAGTPLPLVVNASLGRQAGEHDGKTLTEQGLDAFLQAAPGRAIVQSTGNYFGRRIHAAGLLRPGAKTAVDFSIAVTHPPHEIELWYPGPDDIAISVLGPYGMAPALAVAGQVTLLEHEGRPVGRVYHRRNDPNNGDHQLALYLDAGAPAGPWALHLRGDDIVDGRYHAWIERGPGGGAAQAFFTSENLSPCCTLGTICNGLRTLAVGAVDAHRPDRPLAPFSSGGPTRDGRGKPDLLAPGLRVLSARSAGEDGVVRSPLMRMSGTSMAAPHVSGAVALMFAAAPRPLAIHETRRLLLAATTSAGPAGDAVSHWRLGAGHLDTLAAVDAARQLAAVSPLTACQGALPPVDTLPLRSLAMPTNTLSEVESLGAPGIATSSEVVPAAPCGCAGSTAAEAGIDSGLTEAERRPNERRSLERRGFAPSPLQFQIPIGGGAPSLALPIGGAGSPLAFSVPLGGTSAPPAGAALPTPAPAPSPAGALASPVPAPVAGELPVPALAAIPSSAFDAPVVVAGNVEIPAAPAESHEAIASRPFDPAPLRAPPPGLDLLATAEAACSQGGEHPPRNTSQWLRQLLAPGARSSDDRVFSLHGGGGAAPSATALFNTFVYADADPLRRLAQAHYRQHLLRLAGPGDPVEHLRVQAGDLLLRVALGQGYGHAAVVASPLLCRHDELPAWGWQVPGHDQPREGHYLHVVEVLPRVRALRERWARRVSDGRGRMLPDTLLLRRHHATEDRSGAAEDTLSALTEDAATDIRWLQNALNQVLGTQLAVDGDAGPATRSAVRSFQSRSGLSADGVVGSRTLAALRDALTRGHGGAPVAGQVSGGGAGGAAAGAGGDCETLSGFPQGRDTVSSTHQTQLIAVARRILRDGIRSVLVTGFASSEGADVDNFVLGMQRAGRVAGELRSALERLRSGSAGSVAIVPLSRGESEQVASGDRALNRRVTVCVQARSPVPQPDLPATPIRTRVFRVVAKSFIAHVGSRVGTLDCHLDSTVSDIAHVVSPLGGWVLDRVAPTASNVALSALARATDAAFGEDPADDRPFTSPPPESKGYRLFSRGQLNAQCRGNELVALSLAGAIDTDAGKECLPGTGLCLQAPPLVIDQAFVTRRIDAARIAFRWGVKGRPPFGAELGLEIPCMRQSVFIWHQIDGVVDCSSGSPQTTSLALTGSRFPSHRLWLDGTLARDLPQGPLSGLWDGTPGDPSRVH